MISSLFRKKDSHNWEGEGRLCPAVKPEGFLLWNNPSARCEHVLSLLLIKTDWPIARQGLRSLEPDVEHGKFIDEVNEPWDSNRLIEMG